MFKSDPLPETADLIALISFASTNVRLTNGSRLTLELAKKMVDRYPNALVFGGTYFDNPQPDVERREKEKILGERFIWVGPVTSTTDEWKAIVKAALARNIQIDDMIIVDESYHSIRTRIVWEHCHPDANICFQLIPGKDAADPENPMPLQRSATKWLLANLVLAPFYKWWPGVEWFAGKNFNQSFKKS